MVLRTSQRQKAVVATASTSPQQIALYFNWTLNRRTFQRSSRSGECRSRRACSPARVLAERTFRELKRRAIAKTCAAGHFCGPKQEYALKRRMKDTSQKSSIKYTSIDQHDYCCDIHCCRRAARLLQCCILLHAFRKDCAYYYSSYYYTINSVCCYHACILRDNVDF